MQWTDISLTVPRAGAEAAIAIATGISGSGLYIEDYADIEAQVQAIAHVDLIEQELLDKPRDAVIIHLYLSGKQEVAAVVELLHARLLAAGVQATVNTTGVQQEDWENSWKQYYHPIQIGRRLAVAPSWEQYNSSRVTLRLDPGMAFGTGTHETTFLCLEILDEMVQGGERLLDIGTGSGILAVAALLLGAGSATGIDIDPMAVRTATENAQRNGVQNRFTATVGNLAAGASGRYNIITANIVADAICSLAPAIPPLLAPGGCFIASGIISPRRQDVEQALCAAGLQLCATRTKNDWVAITSAVKT